MKSTSRGLRASTVSSAVRGRGRVHGTTPRLLSIDPGLDGTGFVYWEGIRPVKAGVILPIKGSDLLMRARDLVARVKRQDPDCLTALKSVVIEFPEYHESFKGRTARATGSLDKLCFVIGVLAQSFPAWTNVYLPRVRDWKGQLPKEVVTKRMLNHYGIDFCIRLNVRTHAWDALGIGHWFIHQ